MAGTVAAVNNNGIGVCGVAGGTGVGDGVRLMSCQNYDTDANGQEVGSVTEESFIYAADNGAVIAQCSWGYNGIETPLSMQRYLALSGRPVRMKMGSRLTDEGRCGLLFWLVTAVTPM